MLSILVPFRDADATRTPAKEWMLARWAHFYPEAEIIVAPDDGIDPFNKSLAVNNAAAQAQGDIFAILDADSWVDERYVRRGIAMVEKREVAWVIPCRISYRLKRNISERIMRQSPADPDPFGPIKRLDAESVLPVVGFMHILTRQGFEAVGGMDPRFRGWGGEDTSFTRAMDVVNGRHLKLSGAVYSLWHERPRDIEKRRVWRGQTTNYDVAKEALVQRYCDARTRPAMLDLLRRPVIADAMVGMRGPVGMRRGE